MNRLALYERCGDLGEYQILILVLFKETFFAVKLIGNHIAAECGKWQNHRLN